MIVHPRIAPAILAAVLVGVAAAAAGEPPLARGHEVAHVTAPVFIAHAGDGSGRVFVGERGGRIVVFGGELAGQRIFLDIAARVRPRAGGLRAIAFPFDFADKRTVYVSYVGRDDALVIARYRLASDGHTADPATEEVLLRIPLPGRERRGGGLAFGPDGKLYVGVGEGTAAGKSTGEAQSLASLRGKILRIDVAATGASYGIPADNPWAKTAGARRELWARGLGDPTWLSLDATSGDIYVTDSGGERFDEISVQPGTSPGGENYGWNVFEGTVCRSGTPCDTSGFTMPSATLPRSRSCEVGAGVVERNGPFPEFEGAYVFGNGCSTRFRVLRRTDAGDYESRDIPDSGVRVSVVGSGDGGRLFVGDDRTGKIYEVRPASYSDAP